MSREGHDSRIQDHRPTLPGVYNSQTVCWARNIPFIAAVAVFRLVLKRVWRDIRDSRNGGHCLLTVGGRLRGVKNQSRMCEIRLTKLSCATQQVGIVHFYAVTEIKGLSCRLWWMRERRNLLTSTHVGYQSGIWAVASGASLKFGVHGASATNWFSRVNGARDNGIRLYFFWTYCRCRIRSAEKSETNFYEKWILLRNSRNISLGYLISIKSKDTKHLSIFHEHIKINVGLKTSITIHVF